MSTDVKIATPLPSTTTTDADSPSSSAQSSIMAATATATPSAKEGQTSPPTSTIAISASSDKQSPPPTNANASAKKTSPSVSPSTSSGSVPIRTSFTSPSATTSNVPLPPNVPIYTTPAILALPPTAVLTKQEMDFRANLLNPNNDLFWTARGLIRPPVLADALAQGHAILKHEGHLTQKQGGRRLSAQFGRSGGGGPSPAAVVMPVGFGTGMNAMMGGSVAAVQCSWRSAAPVLPTNPALVTKEEMDVRANQLNPNNDVFWSSRGLIRPPVLADALAQGHAILQQEGHLTQTQTHKTRGRLNSLPTGSLYSNDLPRAGPADTRRSISGQGLPSSGGRIGANRAPAPIGSAAAALLDNPAAVRRRASTTGSIMNATSPLDGSVTKDEVDLRANLMNPNNSVFWTSRGLIRPTDLQEALAKGHAVLEAEGHMTHAQGGRSKSWSRRGSRTELHGPPAVSPLVAAAQRQWAAAFLGPNGGVTPTTRPGGLPGAAWVGGGATTSLSGVPVPTRHPDWQSNVMANIGQQRRRYSLPPPGFELFTPPTHFALFRPPPVGAHQQTPLVREGAADSEWDKMDESAFTLPRTLAPHSAAIPIVKPPPPAPNPEIAKKSEATAPGSSWVRKDPTEKKKKNTSVFLMDEKKKKSEDEEKKNEDKKEAKQEGEQMKGEDKKKKSEEASEKPKTVERSQETKGESSATDVEMKDATTAEATPTAPSEPTTPGSESESKSTKVGSLAWQLAQVKLKSAGEARESEGASKSATV